MNKWKEVAELLGLELEEEFRIENGCYVCASVFKYKFSENGLYYTVTENGWILSEGDTLKRLISGEDEVIKTPWKPKKGDCYYFAFNRDTTTFDVDCEPWGSYTYDYNNWKVGNCFKTEKEAREKGIPLIKKIIKEFGDE